MEGNLEFIREVSAYFMDFLQSNFKSNKLPKRHIRLKNEKNMKIGVNIASTKTLLIIIFLRNKYRIIKYNANKHICIIKIASLKFNLK